ncbi:MAG: heavy metal-binding domain-containing protein [Acidimicrobiia bacterium]
MADEQHPYADPWGLPTDDSSDIPPSSQPSEPESDEAPTEQPEPESVTDLEPEPDDAVGDSDEVDASVNEPEETTLESGLDESAEPEEDALISPMHMGAKNVLDTLGAGFDDLPDEPPDWMDSTAATAPPSVYKELSDLTQPSEAATTDEAEMDETEVVEDVEPIEGTDLEEDLEPDETDAELEPTSLEPYETEPTEAETTDLEEDLEPEPTEPTEDTIEPDLDEAVASALSAIETPEADLLGLEPEPTEPTEDTIEPDLDEAVASALSAIEPGEQDISGMEGEPGLIESPTVAWGSNWGNAAQGWIRQDGGRSTWRPIVTTTSDVGTWEVDTFLGIVAGDATIAEAGNLSGARKAALQSLVDEALSRGAHAVVGVRTAVHEVGRSVVFSAVGTAVTLRNPS